MTTWPATAHELIRLQQALGQMTPARWQPPATLRRIGACFICFERVQGVGSAGDRGFAGAAVTAGRRLLAGVTAAGPAGGPYLPALLALREGRLLEQAVRALPIAPEVLVVNATGRDHPRRAGLALHLGASLGLPTVGVTTRPLLAEGSWPPDQRGATAPLRLGGDVVGCWIRTRAGPSRWPCTPPGRPTSRPRSRWCWPRPVVLAPRSRCAGPARWPEPGGPAPDVAEEQVASGSRLPS